MRLQGKVCLVTGGAAGIGRATAERFAEEGATVVICDLNEEQGQATAAAIGPTASFYKVNVADRQAVQTWVDGVVAQHSRVDVLVNNAGVLTHGAFVDMPATRHRELIDLNVTGLTEMLAHFVPPMVARGQGRVLNVASIAAFQPVPMLATYAATKAYVLSLTESLSEELQGTGVTITTLCPGITATSMFDQAKAASAELGGVPAFVVGRAEDVADEGFNACMKGEVIRVPGNLNRAATLAGRATPRWLLRRVSGAMVRRLKKAD